ncbi:integral membrane protein [Streptomyces sp. CT34]|uniref:integral membrane protein n=1 Tax=Streptomyces sp. CT34 TaxID=1553907 RepID=UPI0005BD36A3|nr:integral membrane protein [Streptomyces sp. CT34]
MSYPNPNPYGPPPGQQPGYGYPQQQPMQPQQPVAPYGAYPGGPMPGMQPQYPTAMPGGVKGARAMLFVLAGLNLIGLVLAVLGLGGVSKASHDASSSPYADMSAFNVGKGLLIAAIVIIVVFTAAAITLAAQFGNGGKGVRIGTIVFGVGTILVSLATFPFGLVHTVLGILVVVFVSKDEGNAWFNRPRY